MNAAELYDLLDRLPYACDDFIVRFTTHDRTEWVQPEGWHCDDDGDLILAPHVDESSEMTVDRLKRLLDGGNNDWCYSGNEVYNEAIVYICDGDGDDYAWEPTFERFSINWKRERVDIWME